ncbi:MAG: aspartate kinase [Clostridiales bacterium]|nr:aspartate kinase [Clostridiales bacterium]
MGVKVTKFGGSSVADAIQLNKMKDIILADPDRKYVVVSAPGKRYEQDNKVTDLLYLCKTHIEHNLPYEQVFQVICDRYMAMEINLGIEINLIQEFEEIKSNLQKGASEDYIASRGEYLNAIVVAGMLGYDFVDAAGVILFDEKGRFLAEETNRELSAVLAKHEKAVIPGFYGTYPSGKVKTFSRGGSDITGAIVARAVNADVYENWTDVSGFLMADPRIVKDPKPIGRISYNELRELAYMGASVLHEDSIAPARIAGIPINIRNTNEPDDAGTIIEEIFREEKRSVITGIAGSKDFSVIAISKNGMSREVGFIRKLCSILEDYDVNIEHMPSGIDTFSVVVSSKALSDKKEDIVEEIKRKLDVETIDVFDNLALIATVGAGMAQRPGTSAKLFEALANEKVNVRMIDQGSSEMNIIIGVEGKDFEKAIRAIYAAFVEQE